MTKPLLVRGFFLLQRPEGTVRSAREMVSCQPAALVCPPFNHTPRDEGRQGDGESTRRLGDSETEPDKALKGFYFSPATFLAPRHLGQTLFPDPWQLAHGR